MELKSVLLNRKNDLAEVSKKIELGADFEIILLDY